MDFATKVKVIRAVKNWTQQELAKNIDVDWTSISAWENRKRGPQYATVQKIDKLFEEVRNEINK